MHNTAIHWKRGQKITIFCSENESEAVRIAAGNLCTDLHKVLAADAQLVFAKTGESFEVSQLPKGSIVTGTFGVSRGVEAVRSCMELHTEGLYQSVNDGILYLAGTDRRGTIYAIYDFCAYIGVSPWYFWADVPVRTRDELEIPADFEKYDYPSVSYRGIFINDEEELEHWVQLHMGEETIGVRTYEKIFELLLRLKGNYIWPAMHVNSFNVKKENGALAERMGIVVGTSHCDMLMRSNNREWRPWLEKKGYSDIEYDYSIEGRNRDILKEYWRESVQQNKAFEVSYTLGMRGIHDSGFETRALEGLQGEELRDAKIKLLEQIIKDQREILHSELTQEPLQIFVPYKEVMELYDNGLEIPEELTLIWANDNYGYIRRFPSENDKKRKGGHGIYYHNSYWAPPGASYLFISSIPLAHTKNELKKAYEQGIRKLWVMNVGALKPLEQEIEFYLTYAWEIGKEHTLTDDVDLYLKEWINHNFSGNHGGEMADVLNRFAQLTNVRKLEQMDTDVFSQTAYGDEAGYRMNCYRQLLVRANCVYDALPENEKEAFFQMCLMKIHAAYLTNGMYYFADRSALCCRQGKYSAAKKYVTLCREYDDARRRMLKYYNKEMCGGKWDGMVTPEDFPPPRTAMYPACVPPLYDTLCEAEQAENACMKAECFAYTCGELVATIWGSQSILGLAAGQKKWFEISDNTGKADISLQAPQGVKLSWQGGKLISEKRVMAEIDEAAGEISGDIIITDKESKSEIKLPVCSVPHGTDIICIEGDSSPQLHRKSGWKVIPRLGRDRGCLVEADEIGAELTYSFEMGADGSPLLELHRFPTLDSTGRIGVLISVDDGEAALLETDATDEKRGNWKTNIRNNVDKLYLQLPELRAGAHTLTLKAWSKYFSFTRITLYLQKRRENMLGFEPDLQELPEYCNPNDELFYGKLALTPRDMLYAPKKQPADNLINTNLAVPQQGYGHTVSPKDILARGIHPALEKDGAVKIDAGAALAQSKYAYTTGHWDYCSSESYGRTGIAMHIRRPGVQCNSEADKPTLNYNFECEGGDYTLWILLKCNSIEDSHFTAGIDEEYVQEGDMCGGKMIWRYCAEQVYRWVPLIERTLAKGSHVLHIKALSSGTRFDRIYLTKGEEFPPVDAEW